MIYGGNNHENKTKYNAFVAYLHGQHAFYQADRMIRAEGMGEDWDGLRKPDQKKPGTI